VRPPSRYTAYGHNHDTPDSGEAGYNGELSEPDTGWQLLGNGNRAYNPLLMRFHSPDNLSPIEEGGLNAYAYCEGDPVNQMDPSGHTPWGAVIRIFRNVKTVAKKPGLPGLLSSGGDNARLSKLTSKDEFRLLDLENFKKKAFSDTQARFDKVLNRPSTTELDIQPYSDRVQIAKGEFSDAKTARVYVSKNVGRQGITTESRKAIGKELARYRSDLVEAKRQAQLGYQNRRQQIDQRQQADPLALGDAYLANAEARRIRANERYS
jgi:RHS repeat-associated protein